MFHSLNCAAKLNVAFDFMLKNVEDKICGYFNAHENNTLLERSKLVANTEEMTKIKNPLSKTDVIESCKREPANTKWKFLRMRNLTFSGGLLKKVPTGCIDTVFPNPLLKNLSVKCLTFEEKTRKPYENLLGLFTALALHLQRIERLEKEISRIFNLFLEKTNGIDPANIRIVCMENIAAVEDIVHANFFQYDIDVLNGSLTREVVRKSVRNYSNTARLLRNKSHICYVSDINALFRTYRCPPCDQFINKPASFCSF